MYRFAHEYLTDWKSRQNRKPLVIRGARQVGKTHLVRSFANEYFEHLLDLNLERNPETASLFSSNNPAKIVQMLELQFDVPIQKGTTLLFLDEIQAAPKILASLRYFYEEMPELHYWMREKKTSAAEVDYVISEGPSIVPVEVKSGKGSTLKSLHLFLREKQRNLGVRFNSDTPSMLDLETALSDGSNIP